MASRCPPGVICIENMTIFMLLIVIAVIGLFMYIRMPQATAPTEKIIIKEEPRQGLFARPSYSFSNIISDVLMNPYTAPLRDDRYIQNEDPRGVPINISTRAVDTNYRQIGILTRINGKEMILPLMGRPLFTNRDKWQFYAMNEKNIKLPLSNKGKSCTNEYGCDNLYNGDTVYVEGYNDAFKVTVYDNAVMKYLPFV